MFDRFKETEIGPIPTDWELARLETCAELVTKGSSPKWQGFEYCDDGIIFVRSQNIGWGRLELREVARLPEEFNTKEKRSVIHQDDVLINIVGASIGRAAVANKHIAGGNLNQAIAIVRLGETISPHFLVNFLLSPTGQYQLHRQKKEIARANLSLRDIKNLVVPRPVLPEQRRIAHVLSTIQRAIAAQDDLIAAARETKRSLMHRLFTYGPGPEPALTKETEIGEIPGHWKVVPLQEASEIVYGVQAAVAKNLDPSIGIPILTNVNISVEGALDFTKIRYYDLPDKKRKKQLLQRGDILFNWRSGSAKHVGKTAFFDLPGEYTFSSFILRIRANSDVSNRFLFYYLTWLRDAGYFVRRHLFLVNAKFNASEAARTPTSLPPFEEQEQIAAMLLAAENKLKREEQGKSALEALFQSTLQQLMTGQIRLAQQETQNHESGELAAQARNVN